MSVSASHPASAVARLVDLELPGRVHFGLYAAEPVRRLSSGVERVDAVLDGGIPSGRLSEVFGPPSSGRTSFLLRLLAATTQRGEVVACVDPADALHPASVAAAGVDLQRVLWVRPSSVLDAMRCTELLLQAGGFAVVALDLDTEMSRPIRTRVWPRLAHAAERSRTAVFVLTPRRVAGSFAVLSLRLHPRRVLWSPGRWPLFEGIDSTLLVARSKLGSPGKEVAVRIQGPQGPQGQQGFQGPHSLKPSSPQAPKPICGSLASTSQTSR